MAAPDPNSGVVRRRHTPRKYPEAIRCESEVPNAHLEVPAKFDSFYKGKPIACQRQSENETDEALLVFH